MEDEPLGYQPARGSRVAFHLSYRQRGAVIEDATVFGVGTNWSCSFRAYVVNLTTLSSGWVRLHRGGAGWIDYYDGVVHPRDGSILSIHDGGASYWVDHPDGAREVFNVAFSSSSGSTLYFLAAHYDPQGNAITFNYTNATSGLQLVSVADPDSKMTRLFYNNGGFPNLITKVIDPYNRTNILQYDAGGYLTNTVDVFGLPTGFKYDVGARRGWITNMVTPYGTNVFRFGGVDVDRTYFNT
jgi:hypothetical protein